MAFRGLEILLGMLAVFSFWAILIALWSLAGYREHQIKIHELAREARRMRLEQETHGTGEKIKV